jgi:hypothetical protein
LGHVGECSRGDSRLRDWPDTEWRLVRDKSNDEDGAADPAAARYFAAYGRDVDQPEQLLAYDPTFRRLTIAGGSRKEAKVDALATAVVEYIGEHPGCSQNKIEVDVDGRADYIRQAIGKAVERGVVHREKVGRGWHHTLTSSIRPTSSGRTDEPVDDLVPSSYTGRGRDDVNEATSPNVKRDEVQAEEQAALELLTDMLTDNLGAIAIRLTT